MLYLLRGTVQRIPEVALPSTKTQNSQTLFDKGGPANASLQDPGSRIQDDLARKKKALQSRAPKVLSIVVLVPFLCRLPSRDGLRTSQDPTNCTLQTPDNTSPQVQKLAQVLRQQGAELDGTEHTWSLTGEESMQSKTGAKTRSFAKFHLIWLWRCSIRRRSTRMH